MAFSNTNIGNRRRLLIDDMKKRFMVIFSVLIIIFCCLIGLGYLGQKTKGKSLIKHKEEGEQYIPQKIRKYKPIEYYNADETQLSDEDYVDSLDEALLNSSIKYEKGEEYRAHIDKIIKQFENEHYTSIFFISEKDDTEASLTFAKFKIKEIDQKKKYAYVTSTYDIIKKGRPYSKNTMSLMKSQLALSDALQDLNIGSENTRFIHGNVHKKDIYKTKVEGKAPDEIIYFEVCDKPFYFWYYEDFQSDKAGDSLTIEIQK